MVNKKFIVVVILCGFLGACALNLPEEPERADAAPVPERLDEAAVSLNNNDVSTAKSIYQEIIEELLSDDITSQDEKTSRKKVKGTLADKELRLDYLSTAYTGLGAIAYQVNEFPIARQMFQAALQADENNISAQEGFALLTLSEGDKQEAKKQLLAIVEQTADGFPKWRTLNALGVIADFEGNYSEAVDYYTKAAEAGGSIEQTVNNLGYSHLMAGNYEEALVVFKKAQAKFPHSKRISANFALTLAREGKYVIAQKTWAKHLEKEEAWNNVGYVAMMNGDLEEARKFLEMAMEVSPRFYPAAQASLEHLKQLESK